MSGAAPPSVPASRIAEFLEQPLHGPNVAVTGPRALSDAAPGALLFAARFSDDTVTALNAAPGTLVLAVPEFGEQLRGAHILTTTPRRDFARALQEFFPTPRIEGLASTAVVSPSARLGKGVAIGHFTVIGDEVEIGDGSEIRDHVSIHARTVIGRDCVIKSLTVIGQEGFGFELDDDGTPIRLPHYGRVIIGDEVEIGALNVIARGTLGDTHISDRVKTDDHVFIAHNVQIGENSIIIAGAEISGSVRIGRNVWIAPQACIMNQVEIGDEALIGLGAVVTKSVEPNVIVAGNPAAVRRKRFER